MLSAFHAAVALLDGKTRLLLTTQYLFALLSAAALSFQSVAFPLLRRLLWYEPALRLHQVVAVLLAYIVLRHVGAEHRLLVLPAAVYLIASGSTQLFAILYRQNWKLCTATVTYDRDTTLVSLHLPGRPAQVGAGQYVELWMPLNAEHGPYTPDPPPHGDFSPSARPLTVRRSVDCVLSTFATFWRRLGYPLSTFTWWQGHPFMVASWSRTPTSDLHLLIQPKEGWTKRLHVVAKLHYFHELLRWKKMAVLLEKERFRPKDTVRMRDRHSAIEEVASLRTEIREAVSYQTMALFSGPHGRAVETAGYRNVLVVAKSTFVYACMPLVRKILEENGFGSGGRPLPHHGRHVTLQRFHFLYETAAREAWESQEIEDFIKEMPVSDDDKLNDDSKLSNDELKDEEAVYAKAFHSTVYAPTGEKEESLTPRAKRKYGPMLLDKELECEMALAAGHRMLILVGLDAEDTCSVLRFMNDEVLRNCTNTKMEDVDVIWCI
ncbi:hypothetical protein IF1G_11037 [Cordyceps javanica]|uniref:FAD-binding 8 domain-containing protein n=1 Tax=Cordyceps javanica TaxID=43265 RepID=A0A545ULD7_9HYPO|nr:hypothetical protein IF1G_11037 [Cordyceps javanica]TQW01737.1 FAD-binding domain-containing protein [Cordyceps javanica]